MAGRNTDTCARTRSRHRAYDEGKEDREGGSYKDDRHGDRDDEGALVGRTQGPRLDLE